MVKLMCRPVLTHSLIDYIISDQRVMFVLWRAGTRLAIKGSENLVFKGCTVCDALS